MSSPLVQDRFKLTYTSISGSSIRPGATMCAALGDLCIAQFAPEKDGIEVFAKDDTGRTVKWFLTNAQVGHLGKELIAIANGATNEDLFALAEEFSSYE